MEEKKKSLDTDKNICIHYAAVSTKGDYREENQDNIYVMGFFRKLEQKDIGISGKTREMCQLYMICDGMGGEKNGEIASLMAVEYAAGCASKEMFEQYMDLLTQINTEICQYQEEKQLSMGTTFSAVWIRGRHIRSVNIGDSRIYRIRNNEITQISYDHTEFQMMLDAGIMKESDRHKSRISHSLIQFLGIPEEEMELEPYVVTDDIETGDRYLICSDGLQDGLTDEEIKGIILREPNNMNCCHLLIRETISKGSKDNVSVVLLTAV